MTVQELITLLEKIEDKSKTVAIGVKQYNKSHAVAWGEAWGADKNYLNQNSNTVWLYVSLPDNMSTREHKHKLG